MQLTFVEIGRATRAWAGYNAVTPSGSIVAGAAGLADRFHLKPVRLLA